VFSAVGLADSHEESLANAYRLAKAIEFEGKYYRKDIGRDLMFSSEK